MSTEQAVLAGSFDPPPHINDLNIRYTFRSPNQAAVFAVIYAYFARYGCMPSLRALGTEMGWTSLMSGTKAVRRLIKDGLLVELAPRNGTGGRPLLVPAGYEPINAAKFKKTKGKARKRKPKKSKEVTDHGLPVFKPASDSDEKG